MSQVYYAISARDSVQSGRRITGLTPSWALLKKFSDQSDITGASQPAFTPLGNGLYGFNFDTTLLGDSFGQIDLGALLSAESDRYIDVNLATNIVQPKWTVVSARDSTQFGKRVAGLTPTWADLVSLQSGADINPKPAITPVANGLYIFQYDTSSGEAVGHVDLGATFMFDADRYADVELAANQVALPLLVGLHVLRMRNPNVDYKTGDGTVYHADNVGNVYVQGYHVGEMAMQGGVFVQ